MTYCDAVRQNLAYAFFKIWSSSINISLSSLCTEIVLSTYVQKRIENSASFESKTIAVGT